MLCLAVLSGYMYEQIKDCYVGGANYASVFMGVILAAVLLSANYFSSIIGNHGGYIYIPDSFTSYGVMGAEYLPKGIVKNYQEITDPYSEAGVEIVDWHRDRGKIYVSVANGTEEEKLLSVPFIYYRGYRAQTAEKENLGIIKDTNAFVGVVVPGNYQGDICVYYSEPFLWRISEIVSLLSVVIIVLLWVRSAYVRNISRVPGVS